MQKRCEEKKRNDEALLLCMPRKAQTAPPPPLRQTFAQVTACPHPSYRIPRWQRMNVNAAGQSGLTEQIHLQQLRRSSQLLNLILTSILRKRGERRRLETTAAPPCSVFHRGRVP
ncbi:hypothetical protein M9458_029258, partial [Cirrhinus mrigala]